MGNELIYVLMALISALGFLLVVFILLYLKSLNLQKSQAADLNQLKKEKEDLQKGMLEPVNTQARSIIDAANQKASEIIAGIEGISEEEKKVLNASFQQMLSRNLKDYQAAAGKFSQIYDEFAGNISRDVKTRLETGLGKIISEAQSEMKATALAVNSSLQNLYKGYETEVSDYKKSVLKQIDKMGVDLIKQLSMKVLGKALSKKEQEDLVIKSLEEAKKLGFFE